MFDLQIFRKFLDGKDLTTSYKESDDESPFPELTIHLGVDHLGQPRDLTVTSKEQVMSPTIKEDNSAAYALLTMYLPYLFPVSDPATIDTSRLICFLNRQSDFPGFEFDEITGQLSFRYTQLIHRKTVDIELVYTIINAISLLSDIFEDDLEQCASGKVTMNDLIERALTAVEQMNTNKSPSQ